MILADGMLDPNNKDNEDLPLTIRAVFIIGPDKKLKLSLNCKPPSHNINPQNRKCKLHGKVAVL
jgi:alkyl hydroperoxide reductase subunit AhpC